MYWCGTRPRRFNDIGESQAEISWAERKESGKVVRTKCRERHAKGRERARIQVTKLGYMIKINTRATNESAL